MLQDKQLEAFCQALAVGMTAEDAACSAGVSDEDATCVGRTWVRRKSVRMRVATLRIEAVNDIDALAHAYWREVFDRFFFDMRCCFGSGNRIDLSRLTSRDVELLGRLRVHVSRTFSGGRKSTVITTEVRGLRTPAVMSAVDKWMKAQRLLAGR